MATKKAITTSEIVRTRDDALPFVVTSRTKRGRWVDQDDFDPEIRAGSRGTIEGIEALAALLTQLKKSDGHMGPFQARQALLGAGIKASLHEGPSEWAAHRFLSAVVPLLEFAAKHADWGPFLTHEMDSARRSQQYEDDRREKEKEQFVARMREAKAAKARASSSQSGSTLRRSRLAHDSRPSA